MIKERNRIRKTRIKKIAKYILKRLGYPDNTCLTILFAGSREIMRLNLQYFKKKKETNVISFPMHYYSSQENVYYIGDIVICPAVTKKEAQKAGTSFDYRLKELIIHGILHLHGYKDDTENDWNKMRKTQEKFLEKVINL